MVGCAPLLEKSEGRDTRPSVSWAHPNRYDLQAAVNRMSTLAKERRLELGKGKALVCAVLGAALVAGRPGQGGHLAGCEVPPS